jgi:hypothetical protein
MNKYNKNNFKTVLEMLKFTGYLYKDIERNMSMLMLNTSNPKYIIGNNKKKLMST